MIDFQLKAKQSAVEQNMDLITNKKLLSIVALDTTLRNYTDRVQHIARVGYPTIKILYRFLTKKATTDPRCQKDCRENIAGQSLLRVTQRCAARAEHSRVDDELGVCVTHGRQ